MELSEAWEVPVVVFLVWTIVLAISTLIVLSCLRRETRRFSKRLQRAGGRDEVVGIDELDSMLAQFVAQRLGKGVLDRLAASFAPSKGGDEEEEIRQRILTWFRHRVGELRSQGLPEKQIKRKLLAAIRCGLTKHPLDLRGSRRCLEAATLLLSLEKEGSGSPRLSSTLPNDQKKEELREQSLTCPTLPCDWLAAKTLHLLSLVVSHPNTITFFAITLSVLLWLYDCLSDIVVIDAFWQFKLPLMFPTDSNGEESLTYLSYQTLTVILSISPGCEKCMFPRATFMRRSSFSSCSPPFFHTFTFTLSISHFHFLGRPLCAAPPSHRALLPPLLPSCLLLFPSLLSLVDCKGAC